MWESVLSFHHEDPQGELAVLGSAVDAYTSVYKSHFIDLTSSLPKSNCAYKAFMKMSIIVISLVQSIDVGKNVIFILNSW